MNPVQHGTTSEPYILLISIHLVYFASNACFAYNSSCITQASCPLTFAVATNAEKCSLSDPSLPAHSP